MFVKILYVSMLVDEKGKCMLKATVVFSVVHSLWHLCAAVGYWLAMQRCNPFMEIYPMLVRCQKSLVVLLKNFLLAPASPHSKTMTYKNSLGLKRL